MSKKVLAFIGILITCVVLIWVYATTLKSDLKTIAGKQNSDQSEVFYKALVLENYDTLSYLILTGGLILWIAFIAFITLKKKAYSWLLGFTIGVAYVLLELIFYKSFF